MKRRSVHMFELRQYSDLSRYIEEPQIGIYCFNFLKKFFTLKAESPETLFHISSNLLSSLQFPLCSEMFFHCVRTCVV